ncbi:MAG TPA: DUF2846 domain-containing protein [Chitinispirillaceae bacterium]|nr:DUF2846 domain-containing protein [Chitinispirillaceae bacterium]
MNLKHLLTVSSLLFFTSCGPEIMVKQDAQPEIKADSEKAVLVIYRGTSFGAAIDIENYIGKQFIGQTEGKSYFISKVDPGTHYLVGASENNACAKITLEAGKIYYVMQGIYPGVMKARTGFSASNPEDFTKDQKEGMDYLQYSQPASADDIPSIDEEEYKETIADYEKEIVDDPSKNKDMVELKGF